jgi:hypothetical protein
MDPPLFYFCISLAQERKKIQQNKGGPDHLNACIHDFFLDRTPCFFYNVRASGEPFMRAHEPRGLPVYKRMPGCPKNPDQIQGMFAIFPFLRPIMNPAKEEQE